MMNTLVKPWHGKPLGPWQSPPVDKNFVFEAKTTGPAETFALPLEVSGTYDFHVDWGDGNTDNITVWNAAEVTHTYASAGTHIVAISGTIQGWRFNNAGDKLKIYDIKSWGPLRLGNSGGYFYGCSNLTASAVDVLDLNGTTSLYLGFYGCSSLVALNVGAWDVSTVTNLSYVFRSCSSLIALDVNTWDVSAVTTLNSAFKGCSSLTTLDVSTWNTDTVTDLQGVFYACPLLTALDVSIWNTASAIDLSYIFYNCSSLTTLALDNCDITSATTLEGILHGVTLTTANYSNILVAFEAQAVNNNVPFHGGNSKYSAGAAATARAALIADHSWTITDGGQE